MTSLSPIRKVFQGITTRQQMFSLFDRHAQRPDRWQDEVASLYPGEWFEITQAECDYMFEILPPLWIRSSMFAMREFMIGSVTSVFFSLGINGSIRHFHGYCDLSDSASAEAMRLFIIDRESRPVRAMTREERLEHIWSSTTDAYRGYAGDLWPERMRGERTITVCGGSEGTFPKLLTNLTEDEIVENLPVQLRHVQDAVAA